jgi:hypothetical protein
MIGAMHPGDRASSSAPGPCGRRRPRSRLATVLVTVAMLAGAGLVIWGRGYLGGLSPADALWLVVILGPVAVGLELLDIDLR